MLRAEVTPSFTQPHRDVTDVIREQQDQLRIDEMALLGREIAMRLDQRFVEVVGSGDVGFDVEGHSHDRPLAQALQVARATAALAQSGLNSRQRAQTCWSGRNR